jgi:hypothetical protein
VKQSQRVVQVKILAFFRQKSYLSIPTDFSEKRLCSFFIPFLSFDEFSENFNASFFA